MSIEDIKDIPITLKGIPIHICEKAPRNTPYLVPRNWKVCPFCGKEINGEKTS